MEELWRGVLWQIELQELLQLVPQLSGPFLGAERPEDSMLERVRHVRQGIELEEFACAREVLTASIQIHPEIVKLSPQLPIALLLIGGTHERRVDREVDLEVELQLLRQKVLLAQHDGNMPVPQGEEIVTLTRVESLAHLLDARLRVLVHVSRELARHCLRYLLIEEVGGALESLLLEVLEHGIVDVALRSGEVVEIDD